MSNFKKGTAITLSVSIVAAPALGKDATGMVKDLGKYTGLIIAAASTASAGQVYTYQSFAAHDGSGKTFEEPAKPIKPGRIYRLPERGPGGDGET